MWFGQKYTCTLAKQHTQAQCTHTVYTNTMSHTHTHTHMNAYTHSDQEAIIASLKHKNRELTTENEELQIQLPPTSSTQHQQQQTDPLNSSGSNISLQSYPSITRLRAQVDVDISNLALTPGATVGFATASTSVPIKFDSHYRAAMEKGV